LWHFLAEPGRGFEPFLKRSRITAARGGYHTADNLGTHPQIVAAGDISLSLASLPAGANGPAIGYVAANVHLKLKFFELSAIHSSGGGARSRKRYFVPKSERAENGHLRHFLGESTGGMRT